MHRKVFQIKQTFRTDLVSALIVASAFIFFASLPSIAEKTAADRSGTNEKSANDPKFHKQLLEIASEYQNYCKVDDMMRWAPTLCAMPPPAKARLSKSKDTSPHGKKLYYLFAKNRNSYVENEAGATGQVVVKEAWLQPLAQAVKAAEKETKKSIYQVNRPDLLGPKSGLFIMYQTASKTPDTDEGWIYGTVTPDGKTVTSAGRVESCMSCHVSAPHGRLFGLQK